LPVTDGCESGNHVRAILLLMVGGSAAAVRRGRGIVLAWICCISVFRSLFEHAQAAAVTVPAQGAAEPAARRGRYRDRRRSRSALAASRRERWLCLVACLNDHASRALFAPAKLPGLLLAAARFSMAAPAAGGTGQPLRASARRPPRRRSPHPLDVQQLDAGASDGSAGLCLSRAGVLLGRGEVEVETVAVMVTFYESVT
jgi:hypothetical protein